MNHYEVNFIIDPVLSGDEIKSTAKVYESLLVDNGCTIDHVNEMGLKQLAYSINKRTSGIYYCIEFSAATGVVIAKLELALRRDERIIRYLTVKLDKYGFKYNEDRRTGKITSYKKKERRKTEGDTPPVAGPVKVAAPVAESVAVPAKESVDSPVEELVAAPVMESVAAPVTESVATPAEELVATPVEESVDTPVEKTDGVPVEESVAEPVEESNDAPVEELVVEEPVAESVVAPEVDVEPLATNEEE